ncbi:MAG: helicase-related protein, partial [Deefgea sp.]
GRLTDLMRSGRIDFKRLEMLVLDEADRMLDMGFIDEVEAIVDALPKERQTALFSATLTESVQRFAVPMLKAPKLVEMAAQATMQAQIEQSVHYADGYEHKQKLTAAFLKKNEGQQAIVFTATKISADELAEWLKLEGFKAAAMHGDLAQRDRRRTLDRLRKCDIDVLVATDVAARGIDVAGITLVLNFDLPRFCEDYIHRIGRTGRAGRTGEAVSLVTKNDFTLLTRIRRQYNLDFGVQVIEGLEARFQPGRAGSGGGHDRGRPSGGRGRPAGNGTGGGRSSNYAGNRDGGGYQGNRDRDAGRSEGYNGGRSEGTHPRGEAGYQGHHRPSESAPRDGGYQGQPREQRSFGSGQTRDRDGGREGGYQGNRDNSNRGGYAGNRDGGREGGYQGNRDGGAPRTGGYAGNRDGAAAPRTGGYQGNRDAAAAPRTGGFGGGSRDGAGSRDGGAPRTGGFGGDRGGDGQRRSTGGGYQGKPTRTGGGGRFE